MAMFFSRRWKIIVLLLVVVLGFVYWRATRPHLTDEQQIAANIAGLEAAAQNRQSNQILHYLSSDFRWNNMKRQELGSYMSGFFWQARDVNVDLNATNTTVTGDTATTAGRFYFSYKPAPDAPLESKSGRFTAQWRRENGNWVITRVEGGENAF